MAMEARLAPRWGGPIGGKHTYPLAGSDTLTCAHVPYSGKASGPAGLGRGWQVEVPISSDPRGSLLPPSVPSDQRGRGVSLTSGGCRTCAGAGACRAHRRMWATAHPGSGTGSSCRSHWGQ